MLLKTPVSILTIFCFFSFISFSQSNFQNTTDIKVIYKLDYQMHEEKNKLRNENTILFHSKEQSIFLLEKMLALDSIQKLRKLTVEDLNLIPSLNFLVERRKNNYSYYESIGNDILNYNESFEPKWELIDEEKIINNYLCKKAFLDYGGRQWIAWYAPEIPISTGPYKFHGLPGLVITLHDSEEKFNFQAIEIESLPFQPNYSVGGFFMNDNKDIITIRKNVFYNVRHGFYGLSMNERIRYMNRENEGINNSYEGIHNLILTDTLGNQIDVHRMSKSRNFIEILDNTD